MNSANPLIPPGVYIVPPGFTACVTHRRVIIRPKKSQDGMVRCDDCAHLGKGRIAYTDRPDRRVCLARPKTNGKSGYSREILARQRYYAASRSPIFCERFKRKT